MYKRQVGPNADQVIAFKFMDFSIPMVPDTGEPDPSVTPDNWQVFSGDAALNDTEVTSSDLANTAIGRLDAAIAAVDAQRSTFGATINRLTFTVDNLTNVSQNTTESRSRILDTDYAKASGELSRTQIIQQAATAVLAQANIDQQSVLKLLQG